MFNLNTERDPNGKLPGELGAKLDAGKPLIHKGVIQQFPRALREVARVSEYGAQKYQWGSWLHVEDGVNRYGNALGRHLVDEVVDGPIDPTTGLSHAAQVAWNSLARLELLLREAEDKGEQDT